VGRWEPDAKGRLAEAAMELYLEQGYDSTTVSEIAKRAGLTERTFFRHFADKREVLFGGAADLEHLLVGAVAAAPDSMGPIDAVTTALEAAAGLFQERREGVLLRQKVINANQELRERELIKLAALSSALADALHRRGVGDPAAELSAEAGIAVFRISFERWLAAGAKGDYRKLIRQSVAELRAVTAGVRAP
jgi:AcrR family transcriptional regulator